MMQRNWWQFLAVAALVAPAFAQQQNVREPRIGYVFPAGGQRGTTVTVTVGGQNLEGVDGAYFTGKGIKATVVDRFVPVNPGQASLLRDRLQELQEKRKAANAPATRAVGATQPTSRPTWTAADDKEAADIVKRLGDLVRKPSSPAIAESVTLSVEVAADAEPGQREIRLSSPRRLTNPMAFHVGYLPEVSEKPSRLRDDPSKSVAAEEATIALPAVVNGQIMPGGVDRYRFTASKGQSLLVAAKARALVPYIADAVPGWFQATIRLIDAKGNELAFNDDYRFRPDPVLHYVIPADGQYAIEIHDAIYRGREDFVYRVAIGELPFVTGMFPLGGKAGAKTEVQLSGWNLPKNTVTVEGRPVGVGFIPLPDGGVYRETAAFATDTLAEVVEQEPNDSAEKAQAIAWPAVMNGRIGKAGEADVYRIEGKAGQEIVAEVLARRLDSPLDSIVQLTDAAGKQVAANDDQEDKGAGLSTHHADSLIRTKLPADGVYYLQVRDTQGKGGAEYTYRLRVSEPRPDFEVRVTPSTAMLRGWSNTPLTATVIRRDGFAGEVAIRVVSDEGIGLAQEVRIPADKTEAKLNLTVRRVTPDGVYPLRVEGRATVGGKQVVHQAVAAEDMMQAFAYRHLVPASELLASVARAGSPTTNPATATAAATATRPATRPTSQSVAATTKPSKRGER